MVFKEFELINCLLNLYNTNEHNSACTTVIFIHSTDQFNNAIIFQKSNMNLSLKCLVGDRSVHILRFLISILNNQPSKIPKYSN